MALVSSRRLLPLLVTQTLGAVNDNLFKNALVVLILFRTAEGSGPALVALAGGVFILPYMVLSATAGQVADRFEKSRTILWLKLAEVGLMGVAAAGFLVGSTGLLFGVLFGLGVQATFFSPLKYSILPEHLSEEELVAGNGLVEAGTFLGILAGTIAGSALFALPWGAEIVSVCGLAVAVAGVGSALLIPRAAAGRPGLAVGWNVLRETGRLLGVARGNRVVWLCILGLSWFWTIGATLLAELPTLVRDELHAEPAVFTLMLACFSVGIGLGSVLCARLSRGAAPTRVVPLALGGLSVFLFDFGHAIRGVELGTVGAVFGCLAGWRVMGDLVLLAVCGGLFSVPLYVLIQERSVRGLQGSMVAANNVVNAGAMVSGAVLTAVLASMGVAAATVLLIGAGVTLGVAIGMVRIVRVARP